MRLSTRARYALRMMVELAVQGRVRQKVSLHQVSVSTSLPRRYLEQLAIGLKQADLIRGVSGKGGGYVLTRSPTKIRIGEIIEAAIGPIKIVDCVLQPELCMKADFCECRPVYSQINHRINEVLNEFSLADLSAKRRRRPTAGRSSVRRDPC